ncbi:MAG: ROK family protein [Desulfobacteraceae bacterium]|jgi:fructokinase
MNADQHRLGIDLGGTKIEAVLLDPEGSVLHRRRVPTPRHPDPRKEYDGILDAIADLVQGAGGHCPPPCAYTVGIGIPGAIDPGTDLVQNANTTSLIGKPLQQDLERRLERPVGMENDANCFTLAESLQGAGRGYGLVFGIIMGTGCGGGLCIGGKLHRGRHLIAGEWGHFPVDPQGARCYCGNPGCVETKISGGGVEKNCQNRFGRRLTMNQITQGYRDGDPACGTVFEEFLEDFGRCLGGLISLLDPDAVVLGGGLSNIQELYSLGLERVRRYAFHHHIETPILKNLLGDSAGVFGAAWIGK